MPKTDRAGRTVKVELWGMDRYGLFGWAMDMPAVPRLGEVVYLPRKADEDPVKFRVIGVEWDIDKNETTIASLKLQAT